MTLQTAAGFDSSNQAKAPITTTSTAHDFRYSLREENVNNFVGMHVVIDGATKLSYDTGVIISGKVLNSNLIVEGTLIVREGAEVSGTIQCDRLIALGAINCKRVVVKELAICWSGKLETSEGLYVNNIQTSDKFQLIGDVFDCSELTLH